jgi:hypothetical protein
MSRMERRLAEGHAMTDTAKVPCNTEGGRPGRRPLVDDELADQLLGKTQSEGAELLGPDGLLSQLTRAVLERALAEEVTGQRIDGIRLPASEAKRKELARQYGADGLLLLLEAARGPGAPGWLRDLPAVEALRQVQVQQYYRTERGRW